MTIEEKIDALFNALAPKKSEKVSTDEEKIAAYSRQTRLKYAKKKLKK